MSTLTELQNQKKQNLLQKNEMQLEEITNEKTNQITTSADRSLSKPRAVRNKKLFQVKKPHLKLRSLYLPEDIIQKMEDVAKKNNISFNEVGRSIISEFFNPSDSF